MLALAAPVALLALSACSTGLRTEVQRFQAMPAPQGQSFVIQAANPENAGGLEFSQYAHLVRQHLTSLGYTEASSSEDATLVVTMDYGVDGGRERIVSHPDPFYGPFGRGGYDIDSYTVYTSFLDLDIRRTADGQSLFEGLAQARSRDDSLPELVPNLIDAMFTGFPGRNGENVKITLPPEKKG